MNSAQLWEQFGWSQREEIRPAAVVKDGIKAAVAQQAHEVYMSGETPEGEPVALVGVDEGLGAAVVVLVVGTKITSTWAKADYKAAIAVFEKTCALGKGN